MKSTPAHGVDGRSMDHVKYSLSEQEAHNVATAGFLFNVSDAI